MLWLASTRRRTRGCAAGARIERTGLGAPRALARLGPPDSAYHAVVIGNHCIGLCSLVWSLRGDAIVPLHYIAHLFIAACTD